MNGIASVRSQIAMDQPLILIIDDSQTIRKLVECHLSQAGYRVVMAADAEAGLELARTVQPQLILLDHQLPGTTGDEVCRKLLEGESTARIPVVISSAMRNRAYAHYTEYPNVVDQIPKPFTPELLKSGVASALQMGAMVMQAQRTGCAIPEAVGEPHDAVLEGTTESFPLLSVLDFLNNQQQTGRLTLEVGRDRLRFALGGGRIQAVYSPTIQPDRLDAQLPSELADLAPLLALTLGEQQDSSMAGVIKLLERSLSDPKRLRALLRFQAAVLTFQAATGEAGDFAFERNGDLPPMFEAFPLQTSASALIVEGSRCCEPTVDVHEWEKLVFARRTVRGGNPDRAGLAPGVIRIHTLLDGTRSLGELARSSAFDLGEAACIARGLERAGLIERRAPASSHSVLVMEDDPETIRLIRQVLGPEGANYQLKIVHDRIASQLLLRRQTFQLVILTMDRSEQEAFFRSCKLQNTNGTRYIGILNIDDESELARLDGMGLDGVIHRPVSETNLLATVNHLLPSRGEFTGTAGGRFQESSMAGS
jgi:DNA-binding response OmpR family regulator